MLDYVLLEKYTSSLSVLFVEDDEAIRKETAELLNDIFPNRVDIAVDGTDGLKKYNIFYERNKKHYDLVITDIQMPNLNGIDLTKKIYDKNANQNIIVLSAHNDSHYLMELVNIGISQFILKPISIDTFIDVIYKISKNIYENINTQNDKIDEVILIQLDKDLIWDNSKKELFYLNKNIKLTKKEILLLDLLLKIPEKTYSNEEIISVLWENNFDSNPDISNLKNVISRLRKKINILNIENIYGLGYRINILV